MIFNSVGFILAFLPTVLFVHFLVLKGKLEKYRIYWLIFSSLYFYANWNYKYLALIIGSALFNFLIGNSLSEYKSKTKLIFGIVVNLGLLSYFKYYFFITQNLSPLGFPQEWIHHPILPLAISFFTFQQIAYLVDEYKNEGIKYKFKDYLLFVCFFPQLIAGPIVQHKHLIPQFKKIFVFSEEKFVRGINIFILGLAKKVLFADQLSKFAISAFDTVSLGTPLNALDALVGLLAYTFQIYFDFSGYSDMAIGLGLMFGIALPLNFNSPYKALNISDFWRRWHITLSEFLKDYLYIPLGGNRNGPLRKNLNLMITMLLGGLWHGAGWNFIIWGGLHGLYLVICHNYKNIIPFSLPKPMAWLLTFSAASFAWIFFRAGDFSQSLLFIKSFANFDLSSSIYKDPFILLALMALCTLVCVKAANIQDMIGVMRKNQVLRGFWKIWEPGNCKLRYAITVWVFLIIILNEISRKTSEFLYYQF